MTLPAKAMSRPFSFVAEKMLSAVIESRVHPADDDMLILNVCF
jgi:hypothetical protein